MIEAIHYIIAIVSILWCILNVYVVVVNFNLIKYGFATFKPIFIVPFIGLIYSGIYFF
jgi:hypothetical protein